MTDIKLLLGNIKKCTICEKYLTHGVRPVLQAGVKAKILIAGQAPGRKVHESGVPFDDASGKRLREWMGISKADFYDATKIAILPMGFCYPGSVKSGDLAPRSECEPAWRSQLLELLSNIELTLVLGKHAQLYHFDKTKVSLTELVKSWNAYWPDKVPLPHPSPRNNGWLSQNPWFEAELIPLLQKQVAAILN